MQILPRMTLGRNAIVPSPGGLGRLLLNYVLSDSYADVALVGMRQPRFVDLNNEFSDDVASSIDTLRCAGARFAETRVTS